MKNLCIYYTRTNKTKEVMEHLAESLGADITEYTDGRSRAGVLGYIGACIISVKKTDPEITVKGDIDLSAYDRVFIGMPVWVEGPCVLGKAFIKQYRESLTKEVYYVVTHMGRSDYSAKIKTMDKMLGRPSTGHVSIRTKDNDYLAEIDRFAKAL